MEPRHQPRGAYEVPTYEAPDGATWFHFLHGNVPGHQIDFIYRHVVPRDPLSRQHFGHLARMLRYIEPRDRHDQAFVIGNLSRDDTQHEPGHGGIALMLCLRVHGARDHAGRDEPSFSHAIVAVDREFDERAFVATALAFRQKLVANTQVTTDGGGFYHAYTSCGEDPLRAGALLRAYVADFDDLPAPPPSRLSLLWTASEVVQPKRMVIVHDDGLPFEELTRWAGRIAAVLYTSDVRWTMISNGREEDLPSGTTIRFVPASVGISSEDGVVVHRLEGLPADVEALAWRLFQAKPVGVPSGSGKRRQWRETAAGGDEIEVTIEEAPREEAKERPKRRLGRWLGVGGAIVLGIGVLGGGWVWRGRGETPVVVAQVEEPARTAAAPAVTLKQETAKVEPPQAATSAETNKSSANEEKPPVVTVISSGKQPGGVKRPPPPVVKASPPPEPERCKHTSDFDDCGSME